MKSKTQTGVSKEMAFYLRHNPQAGNLTLDKEGFTSISSLATACCVSEELIKKIVDEDSKGRYVINGDRIRANQGHSVTEVNITFRKATPPPLLYHGTTEEAYELIQKDGLKPMSRQFVHLSDNANTAENVGNRRHSKTVILVVDAAMMIADGLQFKVSDNGVWLIEKVPAKYIWKMI